MAPTPTPMLLRYLSTSQRSFDSSLQYTTSARPDTPACCAFVGPDVEGHFLYAESSQLSETSETVIPVPIHLYLGGTNAETPSPPAERRSPSVAEADPLSACLFDTTAGHILGSTPVSTSVSDSLVPDQTGFRHPWLVKEWSFSNLNCADQTAESKSM